MLTQFLSCAIAKNGGALYASVPDFLNKSAGRGLISAALRLLYFHQQAILIQFVIAKILWAEILEVESFRIVICRWNAPRYRLTLYFPAGDVRVDRANH